MSVVLPLIYLAVLSFILILHDQAHFGDETTKLNDKRHRKMCWEKSEYFKSITFNFNLFFTPLWTCVHPEVLPSEIRTEIYIYMSVFKGSAEGGGKGRKSRGVGGKMSSVFLFLL